MTSSGRLPGGSAQVAQRLTPYRRDDSAVTAGCRRQTRVTSHGVSRQHRATLLCSSSPLNARVKELLTSVHVCQSFP